MNFLSVSAPPPPINIFNQSLGFYEIKIGIHAVESVLKAIIFSPVGKTNSKLQTCRLLRWIQNLQESKWDHKILYADRSSNDIEL
jgi:hypothetical protein